jgi:hypothetical protein
MNIAAYVRGVGGVGNPADIGRPVRETSRPDSVAEIVTRLGHQAAPTGPALRPSGPFPVRHVEEEQDRARGARAVW